MKGLLFGFIGIFVVLASSLSGGFETYLQEHSLVIVVGGTFVILFISTPSLVIKSLVRSLKMMFKKEKNFFDFKRELLQL